MWPFKKKPKSTPPIYLVPLMTSREVSGFRYFTRSKLEEIRTGIDVRAPFGVGALRDIDWALKAKDAGK